MIHEPQLPRMEDLLITPVYSAACAARHENNIINFDRFLIFSRYRCPVIHDLASELDKNTFLLGHTDEVNSLSLVEPSHRSQDELELVSSSHDNSVIIWHIKLSANPIKYAIVQKLIPPTSSIIISACSIRFNDSLFSIATTIDGQIYLWNNEQLRETIDVDYYSFTAKTLSLSSNSTDIHLLFLAGGDNKVHVFQLCVDKLEPLFDLSGHSDWIKCIDTHLLDDKDSNFLLASASQDSHVRVWHMKLIACELDSNQVRTKSSPPLKTTSSNLISIYRLTATLETVLSGHENIVHGLCWFKKLPRPALRLMTCSADKTIIFWQSQLSGDCHKELYDANSHLNSYNQRAASIEVWVKMAQMGETGETNLPFLGVCLSQDELTIFAHSLRGAIHCWSYENNRWQSQKSITGHFEPVTDLSWEPSAGAFLLSSSLDKTCRLHSLTKGGWTEVGRPQVHGHEINCVSSIDFGRFVSGSEEKIIRCFKTTKFCFGSLLKLIEKVHEKELGLGEELEKLSHGLPLHAVLPALGLSNRPDICPDESVSSEKKDLNSSWYIASNLVKNLAKLDCLEKVPPEEVLIQYTLWWETDKLYGHSNEIHTIAFCPTGAHIASASRANRSDLAKIYIWDTSEFRKVGTIEFHSLTITRLRFSHDSRYLLSVSRDRTWALYEQTGQLRNPYKLKLGTNKTNALHDRIIWDCTWTFDSKYFLTVSRDKKAIVWSVEELTKEHQASGINDQQSNLVINETIFNSARVVKTFESSIQTVDTPNYRTGYNLANQTYLIAFGFEDGTIELHGLTMKNCIISLITRLGNQHMGMPIRRLSFRPSTSTEDHCPNAQDDFEFLLASAGDDCVVKLTGIKSAT